MSRFAIGLCIALAACGKVSSDRPPVPDAPPEPDAREPDAREPDAPPPLGPFSAPVRLALGTTGPAYATDPTVTGDEQRLTFVIVSTDLSTVKTVIWTDLRAAGPTEWTLGSPESFSQGDEVTPKISPDGLTIAFAESDGTSLQMRTYRRATRSAAWQPATDLDTLNTVQEDHPGTLTDDLLHVLIYRRATGSDRYQLVEYARASLTGPWSAVDTLHAIQTAQPGWHTLSPHLTADGRTLVYAAAPDPVSLPHLYLATRSAVGQPFGPPARIDEVSDPVLGEGDPWLSADGRHLYFSRSGAGDTADWGVYYSER
jgi:Tol biopolymer transport system component